MGYETRWWGDKQTQGLGVLASKPWALVDEGERTGKLLAPVRVVGPLNFLLIAVWACRISGDKERSYPGQIFDAVTEHPQWFDGNRHVVVCGDFNSNKMWDKERKRRNHSAVVELLRKENLISAYHAHTSQEQGQETEHTHFHRFSEDRQKRYHIDYIFISDNWRIESVKVGPYEQWCKTKPRSDHAPLIVDLDGKTSRQSAND